MPYLQSDRRREYYLEAEHCRGRRRSREPGRFTARLAAASAGTPSARVLRSPLRPEPRFIGCDWRVGVRLSGTSLSEEWNPVVTLSARKRGPEVVIVVEGEIDHSNAEALRTKLTMARNGAHRIRLDFTRCEFIDSAGLGLVLHTARAVREEGAELSVTNLKGEVGRLFELTGMLVEGSPIVRAPA